MRPNKPGISQDPMQDNFRAFLAPFNENPADVRKMVAVCTAACEPGKTGTAKFLFVSDVSGSGEVTYDVVTQDYTSSPSATNEFNFRDIHNRNCILIGERFEVEFDQAAGCWKPVGSQGLLRKAKTQTGGAINGGASGTVDIIRGSTTKDLTDIDVDNNWAPSDIAEETEIWIKWIPAEGTLSSEQAPGKWIVVSTGSGASVMVPATFTQTGGSAGDNTTTCSFTYTVTDATTSTELGTAVNPTASPHHFQRHGPGECKAATYGWVYMAPGGFEIGDCNEKLVTEEC